MALGRLENEGDLERWLQAALDRLGIGKAPDRPRRFTTATLPAANKNEGLVVYVSDAAAGSKFQGSDGTSWVALG